MIEYIGNFNEAEKAYIKKYVCEDAVIFKQDSYFPLFSFDDIIKYIKILKHDLKVYCFTKKTIHPIVTPAIFSSKLPREGTNLLTSEQCIVYIQQGCSENCICTSAYKNKFSVPVSDIKKQIKALPQQEFIALYGINVGDYNYCGMTLIDLCKEILRTFPKARIVLCNISPFSFFLPELISYLVCEPRIIPVLYMCINSGSAKILKIEGHFGMRNNLKQLLQNTSIKIIPYLIVGSPEETETDFKCTLNWIEEHRSLLAGAIILPYTKNGIGNCNQTISEMDLISRLVQLNDFVLSRIDIPNTEDYLALRNLLEVSICGEDHTFYRRYGFDCI